MEVNETHQYKTKSLAVQAARKAGLEPEKTCTIGRATTGKGVFRWGWELKADEFEPSADEMVAAAEAEFGAAQDADEAPFDPDDEYMSVDAIMARNAARNAGLDIDATAEEVTEATVEVEAEVSLMVETNLPTLRAVPVGVDSEIAHFHVVDGPVARLPVVAPYVPGEVVPFVAEAPAVVDSTDATDPTEGLLVCDVDAADGFPTEGDTYIQLGPFLPYEGKSELLNLSKRMGIDGTLSDDRGRVVFRTSRKVKSGPVTGKGPGRIAMGAAVGDDGKPVRPVINSVAHKSSEKLLDRIEQCDGDADSLRALVGTPGFKGGFTYGNIVVRYLMAWIAYADAHPRNDNVPGVEVFAEAAD